MPDRSSRSPFPPSPRGGGNVRGGVQRFAELLASTEGIYGLIIVAGLIVVSRNLTATSAEALWSVIATLLVLFGAHVYASAAAWLAVNADNEYRVTVALRRGIRESIGLLIPSAVPILILFLGVIGVLEDESSIWIALGADVVLLGAVGWAIATLREAGPGARIGAAVMSASFGVALILLKALLHR